MARALQILLLGTLLLCVACSDKKARDAAAGKASSMPHAGSQAAATAFSGVVAETMDAGDYTYVLVDTGGAKVWAAAPQFAVKAGDAVLVANAMPMRDFTSKTLNRTFPLVYFSSSITPRGEGPASLPDAGSPHGAAGSTPMPPHGMNGGSPSGQAPAMDFSGLKKPPSGKTVAELYADKDKLAGKIVKLRAKVVKATYGVLGKTWLHVQDGTGADGANDLTVTTEATSKVGETVLVEGLLTKDKDIGSGYKFRLIVENAAVTTEP